MGSIFGCRLKEMAKQLQRTSTVECHTGACFVGDVSETPSSKRSMICSALQARAPTEAHGVERENNLQFAIYSSFDRRLSRFPCQKDWVLLPRRRYVPAYRVAQAAGSRSSIRS